MNLHSSRPPRLCPEADKNLALIKIGAVSKLTGLSPSALRLYEQYGLVLPYKEPNGQRLYSIDDIQSVRRFHAAVVEVKISLAALAWLVRSAPLKGFRCSGCVSVCEVNREIGKQACWEVNAHEPEWRRACRACPAYLGRDRVLEFHANFSISVKERDAENGAAQIPKACSPACYEN